jgi:aubergine-like protein
MVTYISHVTGTSGTLVTLNANYFSLPTARNWQLYQYRVRFTPSEDSKAAKHKMVHDHKEKLGGYLFNGTTLYTCYVYDENVSLIFFLFIICIMILKQIS